MQLITINQESLKNVQTLLWKDVEIIKVSNISSDVVKKKSLYNFIIDNNSKKLNGLVVRWKVLWLFWYQKLYIERFGDYLLYAPDFLLMHRWSGAVLKDSGARTPVRTKFHVMHRCAGVVQNFFGANTPVQSELSLLHRCIHRCI